MTDEATRSSLSAWWRIGEGCALELAVPGRAVEADVLDEIVVLWKKKPVT